MRSMARHALIRKLYGHEVCRKLQACIGCEGVAAVVKQGISVSQPTVVPKWLLKKTHYGHDRSIHFLAMFMKLKMKNKFGLKVMEVVHCK